MRESRELEKVTMHQTQGCLVVPIQTELSCEMALQIQTNVLKQIHLTKIKGIIFDIAGVYIVDSILWKTFVDTARMAILLGATMVITGMRPGVAAALMDLDPPVKVDSILMARNMDEGF